MKSPQTYNILKNRRDRILKICKKYKVTTLDLAELFYAPPAVIRADLKKLDLLMWDGDKVVGIKTGEKELDIDSHRKDRDQKIADLVSEEPRRRQSIWGKYGLWRAPINLDKLHEELAGIRGEYIIKANKAFCLCEIGFNPVDAFKHVGGLPQQERDIIVTYLKSLGLSSGHSVMNRDLEAMGFARREYKIAIHRHTKTEIIRELLPEISKLTGARVSDLKRAVGINHYSRVEASSRYDHEIREARKDDLMRYVYELSQRMTQDKIIEVLVKEGKVDRPLTRQTIANYISLYGKKLKICGGKTKNLN